jgi:NAD(P)H dehydrogenase (quinone)
MHIFIVYVHPSRDSFTWDLKNKFIEGLKDSGHTYEISDLYDMDFKTDMNESEYFRESNYRDELPLPTDVLLEQEKINRSNSIVFIYPIFWTEAPAKLVGWFDRVWTYGFAYGKQTMKTLDQALFLCSAGNSLETLKENGLLESMERIMLQDRIFDRALEKKMIIFDETTKEFDRSQKVKEHLEAIYKLGKNI